MSPQPKAAYQNRGAAPPVTIGCCLSKRGAARPVRPWEQVRPAPAGGRWAQVRIAGRNDAPGWLRWRDADIGRTAHLSGDNGNLLNSRT